MLSRHLYYRVKPYVPWRLRMAARRVLARGQRQRHAATWPINEKAGQRPQGWPGWPQGKKFALVLTHDVEGERGLEKCRQLMELEMRLGVRSSFNFIPEGDYRVSVTQREELEAKGFEVGVHDLRHDGMLYWNRSVFSQNARSINGYMKQWRARGFRSGFMLHDPDCLNDLDIEYDASTFDTDPFEPQPEGALTIFPFWMPRPGGGGYVELPYTLPQDSTLFLVLQEKSPEIWKRKLDWIVKCGGMALVNVHPDYLGFGEARLRAAEFPAAWYEEFLQYVKTNYAGQYWNVLPRELAGWYRRTCADDAPTQASAAVAAAGGDRPLRGRRGAVVLYSYYASDPRPRRETEALQRAGMELDVICLREDAESGFEVIEGVNVHRVPMKRRRAGKLTYALQYFSFLASSTAWLTWWRLRRKYDLVHVHNMPDFLVFSAILPKLLGGAVVLDLHDPMPELMETIFNLRPGSLPVNLVKWCEKWSIGFADLALTPNIAFKRLFVSRGCPPEKMQIVMNTPSEEIFKFRAAGSGVPEGRDPKKPFTILYHGSLVARHGLDLAVDALKIVRESVPGAVLVICGASTTYIEEVLNAARQQGLESAVKYLGRKSQREIVEEIKRCDLGVIPNRRNVFTEINMPTRIFEYLALGVPVIAPATSGIRDYFADDAIVYFEPDNKADLAAKMAWSFQHPQELAEIVQKGQVIYQKHCWAQERVQFLSLVAGLMEKGGRRGRTENLGEPGDGSVQPRGTAAQATPAAAVELHGNRDTTMYK